MTTAAKISARFDRAYQRARSVIKIFRAKISNVSVGRGCFVASGVDIALIANSVGRMGTISLGDEVTLERGVLLHPYGGVIELGRNVYVGPYSTIYGHGGVKIGRGTLIAMHCRIIAANHEIPPVGTPIRSRPDICTPIIIGDDVWLGAGVTVLAGVTIGHGAVVAAGAVVTHDLPEGSVAAGVPAKVIRFRPDVVHIDRRAAGANRS